LNEVTPKALANSSPGFERSENPGLRNNKPMNAESVRPATPPALEDIFRGYHPRVSLRCNPGLELANAFGVITKNLFKTKMASTNIRGGR
jgi:hypothetical protein